MSRGTGPTYSHSPYSPFERSAVARMKRSGMRGIEGFDRPRIPHSLHPGYGSLSWEPDPAYSHSPYSPFERSGWLPQSAG
ncbi:protein of unknown function [Methylocaldum szegediense]|uniref:Uncharacterized protein n=1 Tax=Methylocaldum szegediense TaxID=73780 RepID=A0ABM9I8M5_9GAMM|nr:protein of unknown function [Methylocaldum szegediense]